MVTWTILIATLGQRRQLLDRLLTGLMPQVDAAGGRVKVVAYWDNGEADLSAKRQALVEFVDTEYLSFVDDDDLVADDFVPAILEAMKSGPDYVGFQLDVFKDGKRRWLSDHSLNHGTWRTEAGGAKLRDITHINPMHTTAAKAADFTVTGRGGAEDRAWVAQIRDAGLLQTEVVIEQVLYHYLWSPSSSAWRDPAGSVRVEDLAGQSWRPLHVASPNFSWHPASPLPPGASTADMLIIVPSRTRYWNVERMLKAWGDTGAWGTADLRFDVDLDDPNRAGYEAIRLPPGARWGTWHRWRTSMHKLNKAARKEAESYFAIGFMGDDHLPRTDGWAQRWLAELRDLRTGIVYAADGLRDEQLPTQWAVTSDIVRTLGRMVPAPVDHLYCDDAMLALGKAAGCIRYLPDVLIEHMHFVNGKAPKDEQYARVNSRDQFAHDKGRFEAWRDTQLAEDAAAVRALR